MELLISLSVCSGSYFDLVEGRAYDVDILSIFDFPAFFIRH